MDQNGSSGTGATSLLEAMLSISAGLDLRDGLDRLVKASCALTGARYGVLGIVDDAGVVADFVIHGVDQETTERIASLPTCMGVIGVLIEDPRPLRLRDVADHARSMGFPPNHPPMTSFLGVPVLVDGQIYGNLYLTEKRGGAQFTADDERLLQALAQAAGFVIANARTQEISERRLRWLESIIALGHELQYSADATHALSQVAMRLRRVADASLVVVVENLDEISLVTADSGDDSEVSLSGLNAVISAAEPVLDKAGDLDEVTVVSYAAGLALCVVPLPSRLVPGHSLLVVVEDREVGVSAIDTGLLAAFGGQAALALDRTQGLVERQAHMLVADRDRIARDLHDTVIQRLFATALQLQGLRRTAPEADLRNRLDEAVGELSTTIREIRSTIFELRHEGSTSLTTSIRSLVRTYVPVLGFTPFVRMRGQVDLDVSPQIADHLIATLRESLSNVARHAEADACVVEIEVDTEQVTLRVADNGQGIGGAVCESGLANIRTRAQELGGSFRIAPEELRGTVLEWGVPLTPG